MTNVRKTYTLNERTTYSQEDTVKGKLRIQLSAVSGQQSVYFIQKHLNVAQASSL
ncbi:hypothetical protein [Moorena bouillonii]|uniref:hypothetical protein n=1 Tax=Moorena bouillonii TaxID=207920 RepID=UPI0013014353|nr:hypothetical protein [Moorena bouillonii]